MKEMSAERKVLQARTNLVLEHPFYGALSLRLKMVADPKADTFWVDGRSIGYNPAYVDQLTLHQVEAVIAHEVLHVAHGHPWRRDARDFETWNKACDYSINPIVEECGYKLPEGLLNAPEFAGQSAEAIYRKIYTPPPPQQPQPDDTGESGDTGDSGDDDSETDDSQDQEPDTDDDQDDGEDQDDQDNGEDDPKDQDSDIDGDGEDQDQNKPDCGCGEVRDYSGEDPEGEKAEWNVAVMQAAIAAQSMGQLPAGLARLIEQKRKQPVDWRSVLWRFVQQTVNSDYSWSLPNPRYTHLGLYLPALHTQQMGPMVIGVDTSGSINQGLIEMFAAEIRAIVEMVKPECVHVVYCDATVHRVDEFLPDDPITINAIGGGGTDFGPVFKWVEEQSIQPACLVYLTDMWGYFPPNPPDYPTLWATMTEGYKAPFGEIVPISLDS